MASEKVVVLSSGGLNSAVLTSIAMKEHAVALLHARYGHRADEREARCFEKQAESFGIEERLEVQMPHFAELGGKAGLNRKRQIEDSEVVGIGPATSHVTGLIGTLLCAGLSWAKVLGASKVYLGVSENLGPPAPKTSSVYPDYSREYLQLFSHLFEVSSPGRVVSIETPLIDLTRGEIIRLGRRMKTPMEHTWSCIASGSRPCGGCIGCVTRGRGFLDAAMPDPLHLEAAGAR